MEKKIPIYFDNVIIASPLESVSESTPNIGKVQVGVFTKYGNRNGSYITDQVAEMLINSAIEGNTPVVGFFDPETKTWAGHTGPSLANGYGYVKSFEGWRPLTDTDGIERDYAIFTVILFTKYFEAANLIVGQNQSMELDINSIDGTWATIEDNEYFVYTKAAIQGLCVIGSHEPCFSVSSFFALKDETYESQSQKFASLLAEAKAQVEKIENGGTSSMDELENKEVTVEENENIESSVTENFEEKSEENVEQAETETEPESNDSISEFEELQNKFNELQTKYEEAVEQLRQFQAENEELRDTNTQLQATVHNYEVAAAQAMLEKKNLLVEKYEKILNDSEEIAAIKGKISDFSYEALEGKLAVLYANKQFARGEESDKVPLPEPQESPFALLMKKYKK